ncbi:MAG TPA: glutamate racemase [Candidatus Saccharimonadales bacterium]|jgi:glutamate racemase|nr:glutamate racemase [Candidatus Saccharimonadales bacterium]
MKLGVFDSGIGGEAVARALQTTFPAAEMIVVNDKANVPYGSKTTDEVIELTDTAIRPLLAASCDVIILACNTATALAIETLRSRHPKQKFIGIEPMIKTAAALTKTGTIAVCATPATLASERYRELIQKHGPSLAIIEPDCGTWAYMIENNEINHEIIERVINEACDQGADVIVLGCTHYHWIKDDILALTKDRAKVIEPSEAIGRRVEQIFSKNN